jgi:hypothetical protein
MGVVCILQDPVFISGFVWVSQQSTKSWWSLELPANGIIGTKKLAYEAASQDGSPETIKTLHLQ